MSLRALKKRESLNPYKKHPVPMRTRKLIDTKSLINNNVHNDNDKIRKRCKSLPDLTLNYNDNTDYNLMNIKYSSSSLNHNNKLSKSDTDVSKLIKNFTNDGIDLINAKSEISLKTISVHKTAAGSSNHNNNQFYSQRNNNNTREENNDNNSNNSVNGRTDILNNNNLTNISSSTRRMSEQSHLSIYSNRSYYDYENRPSGATRDENGSIIVNTSCVFHIPIIGYEVMEERARFTVYKLRVENPITNDCWLVLRRYTDFVRLNNKLKQSFPAINLQLPRKKLFGDNFNTVFLDNRVQGLQMFVNSIMSKDELRNSKIVRDFFCLDEPPMYSESMEECRAIFEAQEETIAHLKMQINNKNDIIRSLQQHLASELSENDKLKMALKRITNECSKCSLILSNSITSLHSQDDNKCDHQ